MTVVFDKLKFTQRLEAENTFDRRQAEALTEALHDAITEGIATRQDVLNATTVLRQEIAGSKAELRLEIAGLRADMKQGDAELRLDIAGLRTGMREVELSLVRWIVAIAGLALAILGAFHFLVR